MPCPEKKCIYGAPCRIAGMCWRLGRPFEKHRIHWPSVAVCAVLLALAPSFTDAITYWQGNPRPCVKREIIIRHLVELHEEAIGVGIHVRPGTVVELWIKDTELEPSWSIVITMANGLSCIVGEGKSWVWLAPRTTERRKEGRDG